MKQKIFYWQGVNAKGLKTQGHITAINQTAARSILQKQQIRILTLKLQKRRLFQHDRITHQEITAFTRQLATLLNSGIALTKALTLIHSSTNKNSMKQLLQLIHDDVSTGISLSHALQKHPKHFNKLYCSLINTGEQTGSMNKVLENLANHQEKIAGLKAKIKKALLYPMTVLAISIIVTAVLLIYVVPQFETMFQNFGASLPRFTQIIIQFSQLIQQYGWLVLITLIFVAFSLVILFKRHPKLLWWFDLMILKLPLIGSLITKSAITLFTRNLATHLSVGVPLIKALDCTKHACGNLVYNQACQIMILMINQGHSLQDSMRASKRFPEIVLQMIHIGEESGYLNTMLDKIADNYQKQIDNSIDNLSNLLEPFIIVLLGLIVGSLVIAMYLPIFQLGSVV